MCLANQRECIRNNPPLTCCAINLVAFVVVLFTAGIYITHYPVNTLFLFKYSHAGIKHVSKGPHRVSKIRKLKMSLYHEESGRTVDYKLGHSSPILGCPYS